MALPLLTGRALPARRSPRPGHLLQREAVVAVQLPAHLRDKMANPRVVRNGRQRLLEELREEEPSAAGILTNLLLAKRGAPARRGESNAINKACGGLCRTYPDPRLHRASTHPLDHHGRLPGPSEGRLPTPEKILPAHGHCPPVAHPPCRNVPFSSRVRSLPR